MGLFHRKKKDPPLSLSPAPKRLLSYELALLQGQGRRDRQEDSFLVINGQDVTLIKQQGLLLAIADGMGGMARGDQVSKTVLSCLQTEFPNFDRYHSLGPQLAGSAINAGQQAFDLYAGTGGSTLIAGMIYNEHLDWTSTGDSFLFLLRSGCLSRINQDQTVFSDLCLESLRDGNLDISSALENPESSCLSAFLGMENLIHPPEYSRRPLRLLPGDRLLFCSDGVAGVLDERILTQCLLAGTPEDSCHALEQAVLSMQRPHQDNYTALVLRAGY